MSLLERFFGPANDAGDAAPFGTGPDGEPTPSLIVLLRGPLEFDSAALQESLRAFHPDLGDAEAEVQVVEGEEGPTGLWGVMAWDQHVVRVVGFNAPVPSEVFDLCVQGAHYDAPLKEEARGHQGHVILSHPGVPDDPLEAFVALAAAATALARFDGVLVLNEHAHSSFPAEALLLDEPDADPLELLRTLPIPLLYGGFVKLVIEDRPGVWVRTFGNALLGLPDLAMATEGHHQGSETFDLFANILSYLYETNATFAPGHTMQVGDDHYLRLRAPQESELFFLQTDGEMLVAERISAAEVNR